ncbi:hypothetical protein LTR08_006557 [Meristemomyces frigidus]|nr:hypothetical protein LTR08_006557 [Meristemomyces frigidus]
MDDKYGASADHQTSTSLVTRVRLTEDSGPATTTRTKVGEDDVTGVTCEEEEEAFFDLFSLPRELRDEIYDHSLEFKRKFASQHSARLRGRRVAELSPQLAGQQFRKEYLERAERESCLVIVDRDHFHGELLTLPQTMKFTRKLELHVALACDEPDHALGRCRVIPELRMHRKWIANLSEQMKYLDSVKINVYMDPHNLVNDCEQNLLNEQHRFSNLADLTSVEIFQSGYFVGDKNPGTPWNFSKPRRLVMKLSPLNGNVQRVCDVDAAAEKDAT